MTIFTILNSILYSKKPLEINVDDENIFNLYMINRWLSMTSPELNNLVNCTTNRFGKVFESKEEQLEFLINMVPVQRFKKINYLKKTKKEAMDKDQKDREEKIKLIANSREMSRREVEMHINSCI